MQRARAALAQHLRQFGQQHAALARQARPRSLAVHRPRKHQLYDASVVWECVADGAAVRVGDDRHGVIRGSLGEVDGRTVAVAELDEGGDERRQRQLRHRHPGRHAARRRGTNGRLGRRPRRTRRTSRGSVASATRWWERRRAFGRCDSRGRGSGRRGWLGRAVRQVVVVASVAAVAAASAASGASCRRRRAIGPPARLRARPRKGGTLELEAGRGAVRLTIEARGPAERPSRVVVDKHERAMLLAGTHQVHERRRERKLEVDAVLAAQAYVGDHVDVPGARVEAHPLPQVVRQRRGVVGPIATLHRLACRHVVRRAQPQVQRAAVVAVQQAYAKIGRQLTDAHADNDRRRQRADVSPACEAASLVVASVLAER
mmetsp:Transcript_4569/g.16629  ORF Transcript_4569/g.16629 Transcript_4569/m.16629 type:complete len:374 (+) Transcript_4569:636-1757(+)